MIVIDMMPRWECEICGTVTKQPEKPEGWSHFYASGKRCVEPGDIVTVGWLLCPVCIKRKGWR